MNLTEIYEKIIDNANRISTIDDLLFNYRHNCLFSEHPGNKTRICKWNITINLCKARIKPFHQNNV